MWLLPLALTVLLGMASCDSYSDEYLEHYCNGNKLVTGFVFRSMYRGHVDEAPSLKFCWWYQCRKYTNCSIAYHQASGECVRMSHAANDRSMILAKLGLLFIKSSGWTMIVKRILPVKEMKEDGPAAFWPLNQYYKGVNIGTKGEPLDMQKVENLYWTVEGPSGTMSKSGYASMTDRNRAEVNLVHDGKNLLNLTGPFTMALWRLESSTKTGRTILIDGRKDGNIYPLFFMLSPDNARRQLYVHLGTGHKSMYTTIQQFDKTKWRHLALVYEGGSKVRFYINAQKVEIEVTSEKGEAGATQPKILNIGHRYAGSSWTYPRGAMACMAIYERALSDSEMEELMVNCP